MLGMKRYSTVCLHLAKDIKDFNTKIVTLSGSFFVSSLQLFQVSHQGVSLPTVKKNKILFHVHTPREREAFPYK
jgi:predicted glycosyltransferase